MKKYLMLFLMLFVALLVACKENNGEDNPPVTEVDPIIAEHMTYVDDDVVSPYLLVESVLDEENNLIYSLTYISIFPKTKIENNDTVTITGRFYDYYQVDYQTVSGEYHKYFHTYDYLDSSERSYAQNFMPYYNFKEQLKSLLVCVKYRYEKNGNSYNDELKFKETILDFNINNYKNNDIEKYSIDVTKTKNQNENFDRYKLIINFDESFKNGHFDIQTWVEIDNQVYPFVGYYHYRPNHGNIYSTSDIKVPSVHQITKIYYTIVYYENDTVNNTYYMIDLSK